LLFNHLFSQLVGFVDSIIPTCVNKCKYRSISN